MQLLSDMPWIIQVFLYLIIAWWGLVAVIGIITLLVMLLGLLLIGTKKPPTRFGPWF